MPCSLEWETHLREQGYSCIAGIDEAGRGPLAGPVVAAAVVLPADFSLPGLNDSKKISSKLREHLFNELHSRPEIDHSVAIISAEEIDRLNILKATHLAMRQALESLPKTADHALIDGLAVRPFPIPQTALVKGDGISLSIAAASILAKVTRDRIMTELDREYPDYGFASHKGYGTKLHLERLNVHGPCPAHRKSFAPVAQKTFFFSA